MSCEAAEKEDGQRICYISHGLGGVGSSAEPLEAHVKGGKIIRIRPVYFRNIRLYEIKARGKSFTQPPKSLPFWISLAYKKRAYSPNRVLYPLKRIDFDPDAPPEKRNTQNRGRSPFVRISWEEAIDIIVKELKRIKEKYGLRAVLVQDDGHGQCGFIQTPHGIYHELFRQLGEWTMQVRNPDSWEGWYWGAKHVWGMEGVHAGLPHQDAIFDDILENCEVLIFTGCDPETTVAGFAGQIGSVICRWFKEAGIKIISIAPDCNFATALHADKWIPIRPNTDAALYLAIAYVWIKEGTYDKRFIETHTVGFEEFKKYVMGEEDGVPKTPEWAERITGVPARIIKALARVWAKKRTSIANFFGGPKIRGPYSHEPARLEVIVLAMQGLGKPGRQFLRGFYAAATGKRIAAIPQYPDVSGSFVGNPLARYTVTCADAPFIVPKVLVYDAILNPPITWYGTGAIGDTRENQFQRYVFPPPGHPGIKAIWNANCCYITCWNRKMIEAYRSPSVEFIVAVSPWLENEAIFADIILPAQTIFEHEDMILSTRSFVSVVAYQDRCIEPLGESKSDYEIARLIAERMGIGDKFPPPQELMKQLYEKMWPRLRYGISWEEFKEKRKIVVADHPTWEEWKRIQKEIEAKMGLTWGARPGLTWFYELPEGKGLETPTGKLEIVSTGLAKHFPDDKERPPMPRWIPYGDTHQESLFHPRAKKYPLLLVSNHPRWRFHAQGDDITWIREIPTAKIKGPDGYYYEPVWIHPIDAAKRGIKHGDIVKVYNERGAVLCAAYVTERIMPGCVSVYHGSRADLISTDPLIDRGGAIDLIVPEKPASKNTVGQVCSGILVEVEKVDVFELMKQYPEAFKRPLHPDVGVWRATWVKEVA
ncbi:MAG: molybdopterin-dependent oxidoreductase [Candidatus Nezhaarchaeales archaeon]